MKGYDMVEFKSGNKIKYFFISPGIVNVMKAVDFDLMRQFGETEVYNLAFGNYDFETSDIDDLSTGENNDGRKIFNTVLNAVLKFFDHHPGKMLIVRSSDSSDQFEANCKLTCNKKCGDRCRKLNQRLRIYRNYINRNFKKFNIDFE